MEAEARRVRKVRRLRRLRRLRKLRRAKRPREINNFIKGCKLISLYNVI